jgi:hypothetical protein
LSLTSGSLALFALIACGGAQKPAESVDTSSLESKSSSTGGDAKPASSGSADSADKAAATAAAPGKSAAPAEGPSSSDDTAAPAAVHPVPGATGSIDGKTFSPKIALIASPVQKDGRVTLVLHEGSDCVAPGDAKPGTAEMMLVVPWQDGYKTDLSALRGAKKGNLGEAAFVRVGDDGKKQVSKTFRPTGRITVVSAPTQKDATGKLKIDLQSGDYMVAGDLDVKVCVAAK